MQPRGEHAPTSRAPPFQYPRSDRAGCNQGVRVGCTGRGLAFSILGRIERDATTRALARAYRLVFFQYPRSDRAGCNPELRERVLQSPRSFSILGRIERDATVWVGYYFWVRVGFQYPRSDRAGCNPSCQAGLPSAWHRLSVSSVGSSGMQHRRIL